MKGFFRIKFRILLIVYIYFLSGCDSYEIPIDDRPLDKILNQYVQDGIYPFLYVRLEDRNGKVIYEHSSVNQDILPGKSIDGQTLIRIWSMSKIVTISLVMDLIEDKILDLDEPVTKYIPEFSDLKVATDDSGVSLTLVDSMKKVCPYELEPVNTVMTLRHLINHEAGFYYATTKIECINSEMAKWNLPLAENSDDLINKFASLPLIQHPGESDYYGTNTTILGLVAERATGINLKELIKVRMTNPLGIIGLKYNLDDGEELLPRITGIDTVLRVARDGEFDIFGPSFPSYRSDNRVYLGGEGMIASADGYCDFLRIFVNGGKLNGKSFLNPESIDEITSPHTQLDSKWGHNGYNLWVTSDTLRKSGWGDEGLWQGGGYEGTSFWIDPKRGFVGVVMTQMREVQKNGWDHYNDFRGELYRQIFEYEEN
tara:strand:- start:545 stop:1828 length:1284 start_codon:yes stop_codon:yes gene_type:complete